jgi:hypothetical protein
VEVEEILGMRGDGEGVDISGAWKYSLETWGAVGGV